MASSNTALAFSIILFAGGLGIASDSALAAAAPTTPNDADIACLQRPAKVSDSDLQSFMANPGAMLGENPTGGLPLSTRVRELAGSSSHAFDKIMELLGKANDGQKSAIAAGLARVVYVCTNTGSEAAQNYAAAIQAAVAAGDPTFASTFQQSSKDISVASVGPGAAGTSVSGGATGDDSTQRGADNKYKSPGDNPIDTTSADYSVGDADSVDSSDVISPVR